jgi:hypothetical protein
MVDAISTTPAQSLSFRFLRPRTVEASALWKGEPVAVPIVWTTKDHAVATVSAAGVVTPVAFGSTELQAEAGGVVTSLVVTVHPLPPPDCTLASYAETLGRTGKKVAHRKCMPESPDFCEWDAKQPLVGGGAVIVNGRPN